MGMRSTSVAIRAAAAVAVAVALTSCNRDPKTPEEAAARGQERLRAASDALAKAQAFSVDLSEMRERVRRNGEKVEEHVKRQIVVRRPDRMWFKTTRDAGEHTGWYDGKTVTMIVPGQKIFARVNMPPTLDEMLDDLTGRFDVPLPAADFFYSTPQTSFPLAEAQGGWVRRTDIEGRQCDEMQYKHPSVEFTLWVASADPPLPCRLDITYTTRPGAPKASVVFNKWNLSPTIPDNQFTAVVPAGFEQIPVVEHIPADQVKETMGPGSTPAQRVPATPQPTAPAKPPAKR
jgi:hypothetical protein